jgi:hypothetical protein
MEINDSFAASMMIFDSTVKPRRKMTYESTSTRSASPEDLIRPRKPSDTTAASPQIPVIRTHQPSPTERQPSSTPKPRSEASDSAKGRNWAELATFMRTQKEKGYSEIRVPKTVHFNKTDSPRSGSSSPSLPLPNYPKDRSRPSSPAGRPIPVRRYTDDEDWSQQYRRRPSPREHKVEDERSYSPSPRRPSLPGHSSRPPVIDPPSKRKAHDAPSPLTFGARGSNIKPYGQTGQDPPSLPLKTERRDKMQADEREAKRGYGEERSERRHNGELNGLGLDIHSPGVREKVGRI